MKAPNRRRRRPSLTLLAWSLASIGLSGFGPACAARTTFGASARQQAPQPLDPLTAAESTIAEKLARSDERALKLIPASAELVSVEFLALRAASVTPPSDMPTCCSHEPNETTACAWSFGSGRRPQWPRFNRKRSLVIRFHFARSQGRTTTPVHFQAPRDVFIQPRTITSSAISRRSSSSTQSQTGQPRRTPGGMPGGLTATGGRSGWAITTPGCGATAGFQSTATS